MKVLFVIGSLRVGGAESQLVMLVRGLVEQGVECRVFSMEGNGPLSRELNAVGVTVVDGGYRSGPGRIWLLRQLSGVLFRLYREAGREPWDVLHAYLPMANFIGTLTGRTRRIACVLTSKRALGTHRQRSRLWHLFDFVSNRWCHRVVVNSNGVREDALAEPGIRGDRITLIYNGIDSGRFQRALPERTAVRASLGLAGDEVAIVMVANLIPYKGHGDALEALARLPADGRRPRLLLVGDDRGMRDALEQQARRLGLRDQLLWLGRREDVPSLLAAADIGLIASHEEGFCNALLEMMAAGLPVVATRVGGNAEALGEGRFGLLVDARSPQQMAAALGALLQDPERGRDLGRRAAREVAERYSVEAMVQGFLALYREGCRAGSG